MLALDIKNNYFEFKLVKLLPFMNEYLEILNSTPIGMVIAIFFGLSFGSFATMASYRIPRGEDIVFQPSHCPACGHRLLTLDLFPLFSWLANKGKCRHCKVSVSIRYPLIEIFTAILFVLTFYKFGFSAIGLSIYLLAICTVIIITTDLEQAQIPKQIIVVLFINAVLYRYYKEIPLEEYFVTPILGVALALIAKYAVKGKVIKLPDIVFFTITVMFINVNEIVAYLVFSASIAFLIYYITGWKGRYPIYSSLVISLFLCIIFPEQTYSSFFRA